jgi:DNA ligase-associated metallophosphoesterase
MNSFVPHTISDNHFWLTADRCLFWEEEKALILSDPHFGKTGHFRQSGIAVPQQVYREDLQRLVSLLQHFKPRQLIVVGDLFHSRHNKELDLFQKWRKDFAQLHIHLVRGNHDILPENWYEETGIEVSKEELSIKNFYFRHDPGETFLNHPKKGSYYFSGHIHPGVSIKGNGKQSLRFPCFYFTKTFCVLPAFSRFTGTYRVEAGKEEIIFAIVENKLMKIK